MTARFDLRGRLEALSREYRNSDRKGKGALLDEWSRRTGYHRKHLAWILSKELYRRPAKKGRSGRRRRYGEGALFVLVRLKRLTGGMSSVRLKAMLPHLLSSASAETLPGYTPAIGAELLAMSPRTMDYRLSAHAGKYARRAPARRACAASRTMRSGIPVSTHRPFDAPIGTLEVDTVQHKNNSSPGVSCWTLNATCVATGWTDMMAMDSCSSDAVVFGMEKLLRRLPFAAVSAHSDNGSEFMNEKLHKSLDRLGIAMTRSRPRHSNDNPRVEQRNYSHIRQLVGYATYDGEAQRQALQGIYDIYAVIANLFEPSQRLLSKTRQNARTVKVMDDPKTPLDRLADMSRGKNGRLPEEIRKMLNLRDSLDILELYGKLDHAILMLGKARAKKPSPTHEKEETHA